MKFNRTYLQKRLKNNLLAKLAYEKANNHVEDTDWRKLKPLYIQPPPVFGK